jgi:hypothetical protein
MAYATHHHVEALNQGRPPYTATSTPNAGQVSNWLEQTAGVLDGLLRQRGYIVPVSPTAPSSALETLEGFNAAGAWYYVEASAKTRDELQFKAAKAMWEEAQKMLRAGLIELELPLDAGEALPRGGFGAASPAFFTREMEL